MYAASNSIVFHIKNMFYYNTKYCRFQYKLPIIGAFCGFWRIESLFRSFYDNCQKTPVFFRLFGYLSENLPICQKPGEKLTLYYMAAYTRMKMLQKPIRKNISYKKGT